MDYSLIQNQRSWENSSSGIAAHALIAPKDWFTSDGVKSPVAPFIAPGDSITIKTKHEFITDKGFIYFELGPGKNQWDVPIVGDPGFYKQNQEGTIFIPGSTPALHDLYQTLLNKPLIVLLQDGRCGANQYVQLGTSCEGAFIGGPFNSGTTKEGVKGFNTKVNYDGPVLFYMVDGGPEILADVV